MQQSTEAQVAACQERARQLQLAVPEELIFIDEGVTGRTMARPGLGRLVTAAAEGRFDTLICFNLSRLSRASVSGLQTINKNFIKLGIRCIFVADGLDSQADGFDFMSQTLSMVNSVVTKIQARHIQSSLRHMASQGVVVGPIPYGYTGVPNGALNKKGNPQLVRAIDESTAEVVRSIYRWKADDELTHLEIIRRLQNRDVAPPNGGKRWNKQMIQRILRDDSYRGRILFGLHETEIDEQTGEQTITHREEIPVDVPHPQLRIVEDELVTRARAICDRHQAHPTGRPQRPDRKRFQLHHCFKDILWCPEHDRPLVIRPGGQISFYCPDCHISDRPYLPATLPFHRVVPAFSLAAFEILQTQPDLPRLVAEACLRLSREQQARELKEGEQAQRQKQLEARVKATSAQARDVLRTVALSEEDRRANLEIAAGLREEAERIRKELAALVQRRSGEVIAPPGVELVEEMINDLVRTVEDAASINDRAAGANLTRIVRALTGGRVTCHPGGTNGRHKWLRGEFNADPIRAMLAMLGGQSHEAPATAELFHMPFTPNPSTRIRHAAEIVRLFNEVQLDMKQIASRLDISTVTVARAITEDCEQNGRPVPGLADRFARRARRRNQRSYQDYVEQAYEMHLAGRTVCNIAETLRIERNMACRAIATGFHRGGKPIPPPFDEFLPKLERDAR